MKTETTRYRDGDTEMEAFAAWDEARPGKRPGVLVTHAWGGQGDFERDKARALAEQGYVGLAIDLYGVGRRGSDKDENAKLMQPFLEDRGLLLRRMEAGLAVLRGHAAVDGSKLGAIGFCFGGLCVLDLARSGAELAGVVSFHGLLFPPEGRKTERVRSRVLVLHGHDDPMGKNDAVEAFMAEMSAAGADWQLHQYGGTLHAFTNPAANDREFGTVYDAKADRRSWESMRSFFAEAFA